MHIDILKRFRLELEQEKTRIQKKIDQVDAWIKEESERPAQHSSEYQTFSMAVHNGSTPKSYIDLAEEAVRMSGDLHVKKIAEYIATVRGEPTNLNALTASLESHLNNKRKKRIAKKGPATYGLP